MQILARRRRTIQEEEDRRRGGAGKRIPDEEDETKDVQPGAVAPASMHAASLACAELPSPCPAKQSAHDPCAALATAEARASPNRELVIDCDLDKLLSEDLLMISPTPVPVSDDGLDHLATPALGGPSLPGFAWRMGKLRSSSASTTPVSETLPRDGSVPDLLAAVQKSCAALVERLKAQPVADGSPAMGLGSSAIAAARATRELLGEVEIAASAAAIVGASASGATYDDNQLGVQRQRSMTQYYSVSTPTSRRSVAGAADLVEIWQGGLPCTTPSAKKLHRTRSWPPAKVDESESDGPSSLRSSFAWLGSVDGVDESLSRALSATAPVSRMRRTSTVSPPARLRFSLAGAPVSPGFYA